MTHRIHDEEPDTSEATLRVLLAAECPQWSALPVQYVQTSGTDNAMWRVRVGHGRDVVVRLPRRPSAARKVAGETALLGHLAAGPLRSVCATPSVVHVGGAHDVFPHPWSVLGWLHGTDAWSGRVGLDGHLGALAEDLGHAVLRCASSPACRRPYVPGKRGGPVGPLLDRLDRWLDDPLWRASELLDVAHVRRRAAEATDVAGPHERCFVHGDLIPGNVLVGARRLSAIIDWGSAGYGDPAQDLSLAWSVLDPDSRQLFRQIVGADDATWIRARTFELEHAVGGVLYYRPRRHPLGDIMARTLQRILDDG